MNMDERTRPVVCKICDSVKGCNVDIVMASYFTIRLYCSVRRLLQNTNQMMLIILVTKLKYFKF